ncbi:MAG: insulinase family protein [Bacteroidales bacterium]|nr:insulinase family protein [Bacteroidales bacterium]
MITLPSSDSLHPRCHRLPNGRTLFLFPSASTELVKIDFLTESGSAYQAQKICSAAASKLSTVASSHWPATRLADFFDYRGIIVDNNNTVLQNSTTFYTLARHIPDLLPVLDDLLRNPTFPQQDFDVFCRRRHQEMAARQHKSADVARRLYYEALFGDCHPLGIYAEPADADCLGLEAVRRHYAERQRVGDTDIVLAGHIDDPMLRTVEDLFGHDRPTPGLSRLVLAAPSTAAPLRREQAIEQSVQTTLRIGRVLTLAWDDPDYAQLMLLVTLLGGYFGSRLMSNLREDKGFTYGIYAHTQLYRGVVTFFITADVAGQAAQAAEQEIMNELQRLVDEPVTEDELDLVRTVFVGDFLRSVDGIFERSTRFIDMYGADLDERFTDNLRLALATATPASLQRLASEKLRPDQMTVCRAGAL